MKKKKDLENMRTRFSSLLFVSILALSLLLGFITFLRSYINHYERSLDELKEFLSLDLNIRKKRVEQFLETSTIDLRLISQSDVLNQSLKKYYLGLNGNENQEVFEKLDKLGASILSFGFYDFFIISKDGTIIYTVRKEDDFESNLFYGNLAGTSFAESFRKIIDKNRNTVISQLEEYVPSDSLISCFIVESIIDNENSEILGATALQIYPEEIIQALGSANHKKFSDFNIQSGELKFSAQNLIKANETERVISDSVFVEFEGQKLMEIVAEIPIKSNITIPLKIPISLGVFVWFSLMFFGLMIRRYFYFKMKTGISLSNVLIVQSTWKSIINDPQKIGDEFYTRLLSSDPHFSEIFSRVKNIEKLPGKMVSIMSLIVNNADRMDIIKNEIEKLASLHVNLGIQSGDVTKFMECFYETVEQQYDGSFPQNMKKAWYEILNEVSRIFNTILIEEQEKRLENQRKINFSND